MVPVVNRHYQEQEEPVKNRYYQEQSSDVEIKDSDSQGEMVVNPGAISESTDAKVASSTANTRHSELAEVQPMDTQSTDSKDMAASSLSVNLCDSKKSSTDSDTLDSNATDSSDSQSLSTVCSYGEALSGVGDGSSLGTGAPASHMSSNSGPDNGESDTEHLAPHPDAVNEVVGDRLNEMISEVVNGDTGSDGALLVDEQRKGKLWAEREGDVSVMSSSSVTTTKTSTKSRRTTRSLRHEGLRRPEVLKVLTKVSDLSSCCIIQ